MPRSVLFVAVADVRSDGTCDGVDPLGASTGAARADREYAEYPSEKVVVRWLDHAGQFGRTTFGGDGAEADAVILSQLTGKPVRVQWTLEEDLAWSAVLARMGVRYQSRASTRMAGCTGGAQRVLFAPHVRCAACSARSWLGCLPAPRSQAAFSRQNGLTTKSRTGWSKRMRLPNIGAESAIGGLRGLIMRTPGQRQQNFALESIDQRSGGGGKRRSDRVPAATHDRRTADCASQCDGEGSGMGGETIAAATTPARSGSDPVHGPRRMHHGARRKLLGGHRRG